MQQRQLIWLGGALLILLGIAFLAGTFDSEISTVDVPILSISEDLIEEMEIVTSDSTLITLTKTRDFWQLTTPITARADSLTVSRFTENLDNMALESVVSLNPDRYATYGVAAGSKHVNINLGRNSKTLYVGNSGPDFQSFYVRMDNDPRVFLSRGRLNLPEIVDTWRDKTLIHVPRGSVSQVGVSGPSWAYDLTFNGSHWELTEDDDTTPADSASVAQWLNRFSPLKATGFIDDVPASTVKTDATHQIHFSVPGGSTQTLWLLEQENEIAATVSGSDATYRLTKSLLSTFIPESSTLTGND